MEETTKHHLWQNSDFFPKKKRKEFFFLSKRGSKEPLFTTEIIEIHFGLVILEIESTCFWKKYFFDFSKR
jgi:hypothetical protein